MSTTPSESLSARGPTAEELLVARWSDGDETAFDELIELHGAALHGYLLRMTGNRELAEDAYSETLLRLVRSLDRYEVTEGASFRAWLFTMGRRCGLDAIRSRRRFRALGRKILAVGVRPFEVRNQGEATVLRTEQAKRLDRALATLAEEHRTAILLAYRYDLDTAEIGTVLGLKDQQVRDRIAYARKRLRAELEGDAE